MASPRSLIRKVAASDAPLATARRRATQGPADAPAPTSAAPDASADATAPPARRGTPRSLIKELASGRVADVPATVAPSPIPVVKEAAAAATPTPRKRVSLVQMTLLSPEPARGVAGTPASKRKESIASMNSNASLSSPDKSTPKRARLSASPAGAAAASPLESPPAPAQQSQRLSLSVLSSPPRPAPPVPAQRAAAVAVPRTAVDAPLPFDAPEPLSRKKKSTPKAKSAQVGGQASRRSDGLPSGLVRRLAAAHTTLKLEKGAFEEIERGSNLFLKQLCGDLSAYAKHRKTKTVERTDFETLLKRQRHSYNRASLDDLVRRYLPAELVDEVLPVARAGNVLVPEM